MGTASEAYWLSVLGEATGIVGRHGCPHLMIGSLATGSYLGHQWSPAQDIDVFVPRSEAEPLLRAFRDAGYSTYRKDERWLYKAARPNVTIDLIFLASETIELDDEHVRRGRVVDFRDLSIRIPAPEDLVVMKAITDNLERRGHWYDCLRLLKRGWIDWDYFEERALRHGPARMLALLLYARTEGADVPESTIKALAAEALP
jgi:Uncharacterised nucleotidyltransferase